MKNELYIDNVPVDIDEKTNITLNYRSNFFTDVSKIVSNNTYSIKLPMTVHNCKVINEAHLPACVTNYPYINHKGRYIRNGVEIIPDANASIVEVADTIDIALAWGNISKFASIANGNKKLTDLDYGDEEGVDYVIWKRLDSNTAQFPRVDYGFSGAETLVWYHPVVTAEWILRKIYESNGVALNFEAYGDELEKIVIPLLSRKDSPKLVESSTITFIPEKLNPWSNESGINIWQFLFERQTFDNVYYKSLNQDGLTAGFQTKCRNLRIGVKYNLVIDIPKDDSIDNVAVEISLGSFTGDIKPIMTETPSSVISNGEYNRIVFDIDGKTEDFNIDEGLNLAVVGSVFFFLKVPGEAILVSSSFIAITPAISEIGLGDKKDVYARYYFVPNLPDIKQIDFIKAIATMLGMFALPDVGDAVRFVPVDDVILNKTFAYNWTKKVVASYPQNRPKVTNYSLDDFAQHNVYRWKDDDEDKYSGEIVIESEVMEYERDAFTAPFAPSEKRGGVAYIPLYFYSNEGGLDYNSGITPRILRLDGVQASFDGLDWGTLLQKYYKSFQKVLKNPRVITELIEISDIELKTLDMSIPCYLGQYGKFYAIISIKAEKTGICECKLYQLD